TGREHPSHYYLKLTVVAFLQGVEEVCNSMFFPIIDNLLISAACNNRAVLKSKLVSGILQIIFSYKYTLERFRIKSEGGRSLQPFLIGIHVNLLKIFKVGICRDIDSL